jgi:hypothetical protein
VNSQPTKDPEFLKAIGIEEPKPKNVVAQLMMEQTENERATMAHLIEAMHHMQAIGSPQEFLRMGGRLLDEARRLATKLKNLEKFGLRAEPPS